MTDDELRAMAGPEDPRLTAAMALLSVDELTALASWPASGDARQAAAQHLDNILLEILYPECGDDGDSQN